MVDDPAVGLMADHPVQIVQRQSCLSQNLVQALGQGIHRKAENSLAVHGNGRRTSPIRPACVDGIIAPGSQRDGERSIGQRVNGRARAISKEDTGRAVGWVHQTGKGLAPYHQCILPAQCGEQAAGHGGAVDKTGAGRVDVQCRAVFGQAQRTLYLTGHTRGRVRGREGSTDTTVNLLRGQAAAFQRLPGGCDRQGGRALPLRAPVPGADARASGDPLVAGVHDAAQIFVGDRAAGQCPAGCDQL